MARRGGIWVKQGKTLTHKHFEESLLALEATNPHLQLDANSDRFNWDKHSQRYTNLVTQALFLGYSLHKNQERSHSGGHFIVAKSDPSRKNMPTFSEQPYVHGNYKSARSEMYRLASRFRGSRFILYNSVAVQPALPQTNRLAPEGQEATGCIDDNGFPIYTGDTVRRFDGVEGTVVQSPACFQVLTSESELYSLNEGRRWIITSEIVEVAFETVEEEAALDESFCLTGNADDAEETTA